MISAPSRAYLANVRPRRTSRHPGGRGGGWCDEIPVARIGAARYRAASAAGAISLSALAGGVMEGTLSASGGGSAAGGR